MKTCSRAGSPLVICPVCFEIRGTVTLEGTAYRQGCSCHSKGPDVRPAPGYDFSTYIEFCRCCGVEVIPSGSRWSPFFCSECHDAIRELNRTLEFPLIPVGRHSIMNSLSLSGKDCAVPANVEAFVNEMRDLSFRMDALHDWRRFMVARRCAELGFDLHKRLLLDEFRHRAETEDSERVKRASIRQLFAFFDVPGEALMHGQFPRTCPN